MQQSGPTEIAVSRLKGGASVTQLLHEANGPALGDYLFQFLRKTPRSVETIAGLAGLNKSSLYRILNAEVSPQRNVLLRLSRVLGMNLSETQKLLKIGDLASLSGSSEAGSSEVSDGSATAAAAGSRPSAVEKRARAKAAKLMHTAGNLFATAKDFRHGANLWRRGRLE